MKNRMMKSFLCVALSAAMIVGEAGTVFAADPVTESTEAVEETETTETIEATEETATEAGTETVTEETTEEVTEVTTETEAASTEETELPEITELPEVTELPEETEETEATEEIADVVAEDTADATGSYFYLSTYLNVGSTIIDNDRKVYLDWYSYGYNDNGSSLNVTYTIYGSTKEKSG